VFRRSLLNTRLVVKALRVEVYIAANFLDNPPSIFSITPIEKEITILATYAFYSSQCASPIHCFGKSSTNDRYRTCGQTLPLSLRCSSIAYPATKVALAYTSLRIHHTLGHDLYGTEALCSGTAKTTKPLQLQTICSTTPTISTMPGRSYPLHSSTSRLCILSP
jgi:hypothetical protein